MVYGSITLGIETKLFVENNVQVKGKYLKSFYHISKIKQLENLIFNNKLLTVFSCYFFL